MQTASGITGRYTGIVGTGVAKDTTGAAVVGLPFPCRTFAVAVSIPSGAITSWSVVLEGSLDGTNWIALITHTTPIGSTQWAVDKPVAFVRVNVGSLTLNTAPSISVDFAACP